MARTPSKKQREELWTKGIHLDGDEKRLRLDTMNLEHLENTVKAFKNYDTKPLTQELRRRERGTIERVIKILRRDERSSKVKPKQQRRASRANAALLKYLEANK